MKKINNTRSLMIGIAIGLVLLILVSTISYAFAYFTASAKKTGETSFANISLTLDDTGAGTPIFKGTVDSVLPGDTLDMTNLSVTNTGDADIYVALNLEIEIVRTGISTYIDSKWYNLAGDMIIWQLMIENSTPATLLSSGDSEAFDLAYTFDGDLFDISYAGADIDITLTAYGIQARNLDSVSWEAMGQTGTITDAGLIAAYELVNENKGNETNNIIDYSALTTNAYVECTPSETLGCEYYNIEITNVTVNDTVYIYMEEFDSAGDGFIVGEGFDFLGLYSAVYNGESEYIKMFQKYVTQLQVSPNNDGSITIICSNTCRVRVYLEPTGDLPSE